MWIAVWIGGLQGFESVDAHLWIVRWICRLFTSKGNSICTSIELYSCKLPISGQSSTTLCLMSMARDPINPNDIINGPQVHKCWIVGLEDGASDSASTWPQKTRKHRVFYLCNYSCLYNTTPSYYNLQAPLIHLPICRLTICSLDWVLESCHHPQISICIHFDLICWQP